MRVEQKGMPGHFICASRCCFHIHHVIDDKYKVSSVGCYHTRADGFNYENREEIGHGRLYETMVFTRDGWDELDMEGYNEERDAEAGHQKMLEKWIKVRQGELDSDNHERIINELAAKAEGLKE